MAAFRIRKITTAGTLPLIMGQHRFMGGATQQMETEPTRARIVFRLCRRYSSCLHSNICDIEQGNNVVQKSIEEVITKAVPAETVR